MKYKTPHPDSPIAEALKKYQQEHGLRVVDLADQIGISIPTLVAMTRHGAAPQPRTLKKMAKVFQWTAYEVGVLAYWPGSGYRRKPKKRRRSR